jgi:hypothetical protein
MSFFVPPPERSKTRASQVGHSPRLNAEINEFASHHLERSRLDNGRQIMAFAPRGGRVPPQRRGGDFVSDIVMMVGEGEYRSHETMRVVWEDAEREFWGPLGDLLHA